MAQVDEDNLKFMSANAWRKLLAKIAEIKREQCGSPSGEWPIFTRKGEHNDH